MVHDSASMMPAPKLVPLRISLVETSTDPQRIYNRYALQVTDPRGTLPEKQIVVADFTRMGGGVRLHRSVSAEHAGRLLIAAYLAVSSMGHDLDQWIFYEWETGERREASRAQMIWAEVETLDWGRWRSWAQVMSGHVSNEAGVFEVRRSGSAECLLIGHTTNLRLRLRTKLVEGQRASAADEKFRLTEDLAQIEIRWALVNEGDAPFITPTELGAELLRRYVAQFGRRPPYSSTQAKKKPTPR